VGAAAAERRDRVAPGVLVDLQAVLDLRVGRVRLGAVEDDRLHAGLLELALDLRGYAAALGFRVVPE